MLDAFSEHPIYFRLELKSFKYLMKKEIKNECLWLQSFTTLTVHLLYDMNGSFALMEHFL